MGQNNDLFFPEAKTVDKLLSVFNIQSEEQLQPDKVINILSLLNLLNITSSSSQNNPLIDDNQTINNLVNNLKSQNNNQLQEVINSLNSNSNNNSSLSNLFSAGNSNQGNSLDPTLVLKLMNLINQFKSSSGKSDNSEKKDNSNEPVKSEPNNTKKEEK